MCGPAARILELTLALARAVETIEDALHDYCLEPDPNPEVIANVEAELADYRQLLEPLGENPC